MTPELRTAKRRSTNNAGVIKAAGKEWTVILRDRSSTGVCLRPIGPTTIPDRFRLLSPLENIDANCIVVWRRGRDCGVRFE